jgi:hypothetical protein
MPARGAPAAARQEFIHLITSVHAANANPTPDWSSAIYFFMCWILPHRRSRSRAYFDEPLGLWRSFCRRCGTPLLREKDGKWRREA